MATMIHNIDVLQVKYLPQNKSFMWAVHFKMISYFALTCSSFICLGKNQFWCELQTLGDMNCRNVCLLMNIMKLWHSACSAQSAYKGI